MNFKWFEFENRGWSPHELFFYLQSSPYSVLLQSGGSHPKIARYSFLGIEPQALFKATDSQFTYHDFSTDKVHQEEGNPLDFLQKKVAKRIEPSDSLPNIPFLGGAIGYMSYEALRWTEPVTLNKKAHLKLPDLFFLFFDWGIAFDHFENKIFLFGEKRYETKLKKLVNQLAHLEPVAFKIDSTDSDSKDKKWESNFSKEDFCKQIAQAKEYIAAGDIFQVNLAQQFSCETTASSQELFTCLNQINPSPFSALLQTPEFELISCSPERLVSLDGDKAETRPIAGTRPRLENLTEDLKLEEELQKNKKERAEHIMLLDLERNDLGRVSEFGSVEVNEFLTIENYSHVRHLVSNVRGKLRKTCDGIDLLKAMFPGGTITGTPKVRSMEIIDELETVRRHAYTGSLGYFSYTGALDFNILIRTFIKESNQLYLHAGAGIVADSIPEKEYEETLHKAKALMKALTLAENQYSKEKVPS